MSCSIHIAILYQFQYRYEYSSIIKIWGVFLIYSNCKTVCIPLGCFSLFYINICKYTYINTRKKECLKGQYFQKYFKYIKSIRKLIGLFLLFFFFLMAYLNYSLIRITISLTAFGLQLQRVNTEHKLY